MADLVVRFENVSKSFGNKVVLKNLSFELEEGEFVTLLGPSGCGKTTILRLIAGFELPTEGNIFINGVNVNDIPVNKRNVNTVFQNYALFPHMSVYNNIAFGLKMKSYGKKTIEKKVIEVLDLVKLKDYEYERVYNLSGGQQQRVALARALINEPLVLLLDEPLNALDYQLRKEMQLELKRLQRRLDRTFIFVTHDQQESMVISDKIIVLNEGRIEQCGPPVDIYEEPASLFVAKFVGEINLFDGIIKETEDNLCTVKIYDKYLETKNKKNFKKGQKVKVLLRPEDFVIIDENESDKYDISFTGVVFDTIYKGSTVDVFVRLNNELNIIITEFFDEDAEVILYEVGENVTITWFKGWEVLLQDG